MTRSEKRRLIWKEREANNLCVYCGNIEPKKGKKGCQKCLENKVSITKKFCKNNKEKINQYRLSVKHDVIKKYGGKCACCGEQQILFLTIDHKNNDGNIDRMKTYGIKNPPTTTWYLKLKREELRNDLQVLCFNCNLGKHINHGICPHKQVNVKLLDKVDNRNKSHFNKNLKIEWPSDDELIKMCNEKSVSQIAKELNVHFTAISSRLKRRNKYHLIIKSSKKS